MEFQDTTTPSFQQYWNDINKGNPLYTKAQYKDAYDTWASMYYPNAFQAAMMNYQNEWQSPVNQMLRYQQAGLNPYSFQAQQSASGSQGAQLKQATGHQEMNQKAIQNAISAASSLGSLMGVAKELYDYIKFGHKQSFYRTGLLETQSTTAKIQQQREDAALAWENYWNFGSSLAPVDEDGNTVVDPHKSPRAIYMAASTNRIQMQIEQLDYIVNFLYPSQEAQNTARAALAQYQKAIMAGHNEAVLDLHTGNESADQILRMLAYWLMENSTGFLGAAARFKK